MSTAQIIQCPNCKEYISSDAAECRFCHRPIDPQMRQAAAVAQEAANRSHQKKQHRNTMLYGLVIMVIGIVITVGTYAWAASSSGGGRYVVTWGLILVGGFRFIQGLIGWATGK
jgi:hypothetical protein